MTEIVVGYDGSTQAERALDRAATIAHALSAHLVVVSVTEPPLDLTLNYEPVPASPFLAPAPAMPPGAVEATTGQEPSYEEIAERQLDRAKASLGSRAGDVEYVAEVGGAADRLIEIASGRHADLIVVGSRHHGFFARLLDAPVEDEVAQHADCDVLLVR